MTVRTSSSRIPILRILCQDYPQDSTLHFMSSIQKSRIGARPEPRSNVSRHGSISMAYLTQAAHTTPPSPLTLLRTVSIAVYPIHVCALGPWGAADRIDDIEDFNCVLTILKISMAL